MLLLVFIYMCEEIKHYIAAHHGPNLHTVHRDQQHFFLLAEEM